jgi:hypothetical protein
MPDEVSWYVELDYEPYDRYKSKSVPSKIMSGDTICCDRTLTCTCPESQLIRGRDFNKWFSDRSLRPMDVYEFSNDNLDCMGCSRFNTRQCIPLRNWMRYHQVTGNSPGKITLCRYLNIDEAYCRDENIDHKELIDAMEKHEDENEQERANS